MTQSQLLVTTETRGICSMVKQTSHPIRNRTALVISSAPQVNGALVLRNADDVQNDPTRHRMQIANSFR